MQRGRIPNKGMGTAGSQRRGTLHNQYLNKNCYFYNNWGTFFIPKSEETFIQETMFYINLDLFQQTQIVIIALSAIKIIPWFHLVDLVNYQDIGLIIFLAVSYLTGYSLRNKKQHHLQRFIILIVIFLELMIIQFMLLDKDLVDQQLWQALGQIGVVILNTLALTTPVQSLIITFFVNILLKFMMLCRGKEQFSGCNTQTEPTFISYCHISNLYGTTLEDFIGTSNNLVTVYPMLSFAIYYIVNRMMRRYWIFINSFQKSDKCNSHLSSKNMATFFIIDSHLQFVFYTEKGQQFIRNCEESNDTRITNFSQLLNPKEQQTGVTKDKNQKNKMDIFKEKIQEIIQQDKEIELEMWLDENLGKGANNNNTNNLTEESIFEQADTVGLTQNENYQKVFYKLRMGPIAYKGSKMIQIILERQSKVSDIVQINEYFHDVLFKNSSDNISQLEKDYLKWYNMVSLGVIKNDDLKDLSKCIHEYHQQYIYLYSIRKLNNEFHRIDFKNLNEFNIKANIIQAVEIVLVKKLHLVNQIKVQFEGSFPSHEVLADDILFHHMMVSILDLIIQPVEEKPEQKQIDNQSFKNSPQIGLGGESMQPRQVAEPVYKKFDFKVDCKLKQIRRNEILDLQFIFEFHCFPETEKLLQKVFKKVRNMDVNEFVQPSDLLDQGKDYVNLFLIFLQLRRQDCEFELERKSYHDGIINDMHRDSNDEAQTEGECNPKSSHNTNIYLLSVSLSAQPVSMQTFPGKYNSGGDSMQKMRVGSNMAATVTQQMTQKNQQKNTIRCPAPLNLSFARDPKINMQKNVFIWQYRDGKETKKTNFDKSRKKPTQISSKIFSNAQQNSRINKLPTNKDIDSQQTLSSSQQNIPPGQQNMNNSAAPHNKGMQNQVQITNQSSGNNLTTNKKESEDISQSVNLQNSGSQGQISSQNPIPLPIQSLNQQTSIYHRDSVRKQSSLCSDLNIQKMGMSSPKQVPMPSHHNKNRRRTSIIGGFPANKQFSDEGPIVSNKVRSLSRQVSQKIQEEVNTSEEEEKKDLLLSDQKQSSSNSQYKMPSSQRKIPENVSLSLSAQKSAQSQNSQTSFGQGGSITKFSSVQVQCPSESKIGINSRQQSGERLITPIKTNYEKDDLVKINEFASENVLQDSENEELKRKIKTIQKQIAETLKLYKPLFVQDTSLVVKQIISHTKTFEGQEK